jgi:hypothetical protein
VNPDPRRWLLRAVLLLPAYWVLRDTVRLHASDYVSLVVIPWALLLLASWLLAGRIFDPRQERLRLVLAVIGLVCGWGVLQTGRMATRVVLLPCLVVAAASVVSVMARAATVALVLLGASEAALRLRPDLLSVEARRALPLGARDRLACSFRAPDGCLPADALQVFSPALAFAYKPNLDVMLWNAESGAWTLRTDDRGFPNRDSTLHGRADVVVIGDSFAQGVLVEPEESFPARLAAATGRRVLNLGVRGWDAYQYPLALEKYGLRARPRVVVVAISGASDWDTTFPRWLAYRSDHQGVDYRDFLEADERRRQSGTPGTFGLPERLYRRAFLPAALGALLHPTQMGGAPSRDWDELTFDGHAVPLRLRAALDRWLDVDAERLLVQQRSGIEQLARSVARLRALAAAARARLVILYVPAMEEVYLPLVEAASPFWEGTSRDRLLEKIARLRAVVTSLARRDELLDLTGPLGDVAGRGESLYWIHDPHWNRRGNAAVAGIVARHLGAGREAD